MLKMKKKTYPKKTLFALFIAVFTLLASACGSTENDAETTPNKADATTTASSEAAEAATDDLPKDSERIISLDPSTTEILFALGAGEKVIAADKNSNYPAEAPKDEGLDSFSLDIEKVLSLDPDLVLAGNTDETLVAALESNDIAYNVQLTPQTMDDLYAYVADLGVMTGQIDEAAELNTDLRDAITDATATLEASDATGTKVYYEVGASDNAGYYVSHDGTFAGDLLKLIGLENIASADDMDEANELDPEIILTADPALILVNAPAGKEAAKVEEISQRDAWSDIAAVKNKNIVAIDADIGSRHGPRIVDFVEAVTEAAVAVPVAS